MPDIIAVQGTSEGAIGDFDAAISEGCSVGGDLEGMMDDLAAIARALAVEGIGQTTADAQKISEALASLAEGDSLRDEGKFKDAVNKYKDALAKVS